MNSPLHLRTAVLHALTAVGATLFIVFHTSVYLGMVVAGSPGAHDHDHDHSHSHEAVRLATNASKTSSLSPTR